MQQLTQSCKAWRSYDEMMLLLLSAEHFFPYCNGVIYFPPCKASQYRSVHSVGWWRISVTWRSVPAPWNLVVTHKEPPPPLSPSKILKGSDHPSRVTILLSIHHLPNNKGIQLPRRINSPLQQATSFRCSKSQHTQSPCLCNVCIPSSLVV